jgi:pyruvate kinase
MVRHVRRAERDTGRACRVLMDLGGPKLRVGPVQTGRGEIRLKVKRDARGKVLRPCRVVLDASGAPPGETLSPPHLAVGREWLDTVQVGDRVRFTDLRRRPRAFIAEKRLSASQVLARLDRSAYLDETTTLEHVAANGGNGGAPVPPSPRATQRLGPIAASTVEIRVMPGDVLLLTRSPLPGEPKRVSRKGKLVFPAHIACSESRIFEALKVGHHVWIDDGKVGTVVETLDEHGAWLRVQRARPTGERLGPGKGMNFPDSALPLEPLSDTDLADLDFAVKHADMVGFSFVRAPADIDRLVAELKARGRSDMGIVAKIETRAALKNLPEIIVRGAGRQPFGIMIARGDLAVEIGYERLAEAQEEILSLCEAAHVPVIWATQVLENLVKQGRPSRAELTDAAMSERAECVMLNKGPYLLHALDVLDAVVTRMQVVLRKKTSQFAPRRWS